MTRRNNHPRTTPASASPSLIQASSTEYQGEDISFRLVPFRLVLIALVLFLLSVATSAGSRRAGEAQPAIELAPSPQADTVPQAGTVPEVLVFQNADERVNELAEQMLPEFRQVLKAELFFLDRVCQPTKEQRQQLSKAGDACAQEAAKTFAQVQQKRMQQQNGEPTYPDPHKTIQEGLARSVKLQLSAEQAARYQDEVDKRKASLQRVTLLNLVAMLDVELVLSSEQRDRLLAALSRNWQDAWGQSLEIYVNNEQLLPKLPDDVVIPILNETQKKVWQDVPKHEVAVWGGFGFGGMMEDDPPDDGPPAEMSELAPKPEEKK